MYLTVQNVSFSPEKANIAKLRISFYANVENLSEKNPYLVLAIAKLKLAGDVISSVETILTAQYMNRTPDLRDVVFTFTKENLEAIERKRVDDLALEFRLECLFSYQSPNSESQVTAFSNSTTSTSIKFSQKEWVGILEVFGYYDAWVIEIPKPKFQGFDLVGKHLDGARGNLLQNDFGGCVSSLRNAWNSLKPFVDARWNEISGLLDDGSPGESGKDPKSVRVKKLKDNIHTLSQIGAHQEFYKVNPEDAWLIYYETVAMISYLSRLFSKLPDKE